MHFQCNENEMCVDEEAVALRVCQLPYCLLILSNQIKLFQAVKHNKSCIIDFEEWRMKLMNRMSNEREWLCQLFLYLVLYTKDEMESEFKEVHVG